MSRAKDERRRLEKIAESFTVLHGFDSKLIKFRYREIHPFIKGPRVLELGPADGGMTEELVKDFAPVDCVDGSQRQLGLLEKRFGSKVRCHVSLFETFDPGKIRFDTVVMAHILEHVQNPRAVLVRARSWLKPGGVLIV